MRNTNAQVANERLQVPSSEGATQHLAHILARGLPLLYGRAYRLLGNRADAEDAVQGALLAAYSHLHQFRGQAQMSTRLGSIVLNCARMQLRRRSRQPHVSLDEPTREIQTLSLAERLADRRPSPEDECRSGALSARLIHFQNQLSPTLRRTFQICDVDGLSIRETAQILGIPCGTVKAQATRARQKLKELMRRSVKPASRSLLNRLPVSETQQKTVSILPLDILNSVVQPTKEERTVTTTDKVLGGRLPLTDPAPMTDVQRGLY